VLVQIQLALHVTQNRIQPPTNRSNIEIDEALTALAHMLGSIKYAARLAERDWVTSL
jgi:hypothetical protein